MSHGNKKIDGPIETPESKKKLKVPTSKKITDAINRITTISESRLIVVSTLMSRGTSIGEVMDEITQMEVIISHMDLFLRCCQLMMSNG